MGKTKNKKIKIKQGRLEAREARMGYLFLLPWLIGVVVFLLFPLGQSFYYMWFNIRITPLATYIIHGKSFAHKIARTGRFSVGNVTTPNRRIGIFQMAKIR